MKGNIKKILLPIVFLMLILLSGCTKEGFVADKVSVMGVEIGGMSREEAINALSGITLDTAKEAVIMADGKKIVFSADQIGASYNAEKTADDVIKKSKGVFSGWFKKEYNMAVDINSEKLEEALKSVETEGSATKAEITENGIMITNAYPSKVLDREDLTDKIAQYFGGGNTGEIEMSFTISHVEGQGNSELLSSLSNEYKEAEYIRNPDGTITVTDSSVGVVFDMDSALKNMEQHTKEGEVFTIPCEVISPEHTKEELEAALFRDTLGTYKTNYSTSSANRCANIALASQSIDNMILMPGDVFSFNDALGERTSERGYKPAGAYAAGKTVTEVGGGICQVSSTLYNTVLLSNLEIVERRSHQMTVAYVPVGRDATVNWGTTDFKFKNNTPYPVKLESTIRGKNIEISAVGTLSDPDMKVKIETSTLSVIPPVEEIVEDPEKEVGFTETDKGSNGYIVDAVRVVYSSDTEVSREKLTRSRYNPSNTVTTVGTKVPEGMELGADGTLVPVGSIVPIPEDDTIMPPGLLPPDETVTGEQSSDTGL